MRANENRLDWEALKLVLGELSQAIADDNYPRIRSLFTDVVDGYHPEGEMVDWIHLHHTATCGEVPQPAR